MDPRAEAPIDPVCERCAVPIVDMSSALEREGQTYCCANCARADMPEERPVPERRRACSRCGAPVVDRSHAVTEQVNLFCCGNCAKAGVRAEPLQEV